MHFYTYDEWVANNYYSKDSKEIIKGQTQIVELIDGTFNPNYLTIRSCWRDPQFISTYSGTPYIVPETSTIDLDVGCLYELSSNNSSNILERPTNKGCLQFLKPLYDPGNSNLGSLDDSPYVKLYNDSEYYDNFTQLNKEIIAINLNSIFSTSSPMVKQLLIFQSIYDGAVSFEAADSSLEFFFTDVQPYTSQYDFRKYDYKMYTNLHNSSSLMIASALISFETIDTYKYVIIENISKFVYGHIDMDEKFNWGLLWETYTPSRTPLSSSIMHYRKR